MVSYWLIESTTPVFRMKEDKSQIVYYRETLERLINLLHDRFDVGSSMHIEILTKDILLLVLFLKTFKFNNVVNRKNNSEF